MTVVHICEACREVVDPTAPDVVRMVEWEEVPAMGDAATEWVEGYGVFFHRAHAPRPSNRLRFPGDEL